MTPADLFDRAGRALYGDLYVAPLAALLGVDKNTVGKWRSGKSDVPVGVWATLEKAVMAREEECGAVVEAIVSAHDARRAAQQKNPSFD